MKSRISSYKPLAATVLIICVFLLTRFGILCGRCDNNEQKCRERANLVSRLRLLCKEINTPKYNLSSIAEIEKYSFDRMKAVSNIIVNCTAEYLMDLGKYGKSDLFFVDYFPNIECISFPYGVPKSVLFDNKHLLSVPLIILPFPHQRGEAPDESGGFAAKTRRFVFLHNMFVAYMLSDKYFMDRPRSGYKRERDLIYWRTNWDGFFLNFKREQIYTLMILGEHQLAGKVEEFFPPELLDQVKDEWPPPQREDGAAPPPAPNSVPPPSPTIKAHGDGDRDGEAKQ